MQPALKLLNSAEITCLLEGNAHKYSTFYTIKTHAALWTLFFLKNPKVTRPYAVLEARLAV